MRLVESLVLLVLLTLSFSFPEQAWAQDPGCGECPETGECPPEFRADISCPCPVTGECPPELLIFQFDELNQLVRSGRLSGLMEDSASLSSLRYKMPSSILSRGAGSAGQLAIPVSFYEENRIYFNKDLLAFIGREPPRSVPELVDVFEQAKDHGVLPIAIGEGGAEHRSLFYSLLAGISFEELRSILEEPARADLASDEVRQALESYKRIMDLTEPMHVQVQDASLLVARGEALAQVAGGWAERFYEPDMSQTVECRAFPGTQDLILASGLTLFSIEGNGSSESVSYAAEAGFAVAFAKRNYMRPVLESWENPFKHTCDNSSDAITVGQAQEHGSFAFTDDMNRDLEDQIEIVLGRIRSEDMSVNEAQFILERAAREIAY